MSRFVKLRSALLLSLIWISVMSVFLPMGGQLAQLEADAFQAHLRAQLEISSPVPAALGAAQHVAHYAIPALAR